MINKAYPDKPHPLLSLDNTLKSLGVGVRIPSDVVLPNLDTNSLKFISTYADALSEARDHYKDQVSLKSLWLFLNRLRWKYPFDLFDKLKDGDVVEIYTMYHTQIFRSFIYFKFCSYSLEKLYAYPWFQLFGRDTSVESASLTLIERGIRGELKGVEPMNIQPHWISELNSSDPYRTYIKPQYCCMLYERTGKLSGYLASSQILQSTRGHS